MLADIRPGQWINVKVTKRPRAEAQRKTIMRLLQKDAGVKKEATRAKRARPVAEHQRGGRMWKDRPHRVPVVQAMPGPSYKLFASVDVLRDLKSVEKYVDVVPV